MRDKVNFEEYLEQYGSLTYRNTGVSMLPLIRQGKDLFTIIKKDNQRCCKGDVVLFRRKEDYVLHRVVSVLETGYWILGDNCIKKEYVEEGQILGIMTEVIRNGRTISVMDRGYRCYSNLWMAFYPVRKVWMVGRGKAASVIRKGKYLLKSMQGSEKNEQV